MQYQLHSKNVIITDSLQQYFDTKLSNIDKLGQKIVSCRVELTRDQHHNKGEIFNIQIHLSVPGKFLKITEASADARTCMDTASDKLIRQLKKHIAKKRDRIRRAKR